MKVIVTRTEAGHIVRVYTFERFLKETGLTADQYTFLNNHGYCHDQDGRELLMEDICEKLDRSEWAFLEDLIA